MFKVASYTLCFMAFVLMLHVHDVTQITITIVSCWVFVLVVIEKALACLLWAQSCRDEPPFYRHVKKAFFKRKDSGRCLF